MLSCMVWPSMAPSMALIISKLMCFLALFFFFLLFNGAKANIQHDAEALLAFKSNVSSSQGKLVSWNSSAINSLCYSWRGVTCSNGSSSDQRVIILRLPGLSLRGPIPSQTLGKLDALEILSLRDNNLSGDLLADLANCTSLKQLFLFKNSFSGHLPQDFSVWPNMTQLNLSFNKFSGEIPTSLNNLTKLQSLSLENNTLSGSIPSLNISSLSAFSVANNNLSGSIPSSLSKFSAASFTGNSDLCGASLTSCSGVGGPAPAPAPAPSSPPPPPSSEPSGRKLSWGAIVGIVIGAVAFAVIAASVCFCLLGRKSRKQGEGGGSTDLFAAGRSEFKAKRQENNNTGGQSNIGPGNGSAENTLIFVGSAKPTFQLDDLLRSSAEVLGKGSLGAAYKVVLDSGLVVGVKRLRDVAYERKDDCKTVIEKLGALHHPNLVPLQAYCFAQNEKLFVSDFMPNGSLSSVLHQEGEGGILDWERRLTIAGAVVRGLSYLHSQKVVHGSIKSSNVVLNREGEACLTDYGLIDLASIQPGPNSNFKPNGYTPPEASAELTKITYKGDVYAFGVLLLELLTGKSPIALAQLGLTLPTWVQSNSHEDKALDPNLMKSDSIHEQMIELLHIALPCVSPSPHQRPHMVELVKRIESLKKHENDDYSSDSYFDHIPSSA